MLEPKLFCVRTARRLLACLFAYLLAGWLAGWLACLLVSPPRGLGNYNWLDSMNQIQQSCMGFSDRWILYYYISFSLLMLQHEQSSQTTFSVNWNVFLVEICQSCKKKTTECLEMWKNSSTQSFIFFNISLIIIKTGIKFWRNIP